jgi:hypothetical protein
MSAISVQNDANMTRHWPLLELIKQPAPIAKGLSAAGALVIRSAALEPRGYAETREAAMAAFAKSWRRE